MNENQKISAFPLSLGNLLLTRNWPICEMMHLSWESPSLTTRAIVNYLLSNSHFDRIKHVKELVRFILTFHLLVERSQANQSSTPIIDLLGFISTKVFSNWSFITCLDENIETLWTSVRFWRPYIDYSIQIKGVQLCSSDWLKTFRDKSLSHPVVQEITETETFIGTDENPFSSCWVEMFLLVLQS